MDRTEVDQWAQREKLTLEILNQLRADGFHSLDDIALLTSADINQYERKRSLTKAQCLRLEKAVQGLKMKAGEATIMGTQNINRHQLQGGRSSESQGMDQWAQREKLNPETLNQLRADGFDIALLTSADINQYASQRSPTMAQCLRLEKAVQGLTMEVGEATAVSTQNINRHQLQGGRSLESQEVDQWAQREMLTLEILNQLRADGFHSLEDIALLTSADINQYECKRSLTKAQCLRLEKAVQGLTMKAGETTIMGTQNINSHQLQGGRSSESQEMEQWAQREKLAAETLSALRENGFESLEDLTFLTSTAINNIFSDLLTKAQCLRLEKAVQGLKGETNTATTIGSENFDDHEFQEMKQWAQREKLAPETLSKLRENGFKSLEDLCILTSAEINNMCPSLLTKAQSLRLEKAVQGLKEENKAATTMGSEDFDDHEFKAGRSRKSEEIYQWAHKQNLPPEILEILCKDGFTSLEDLALLTSAEINKYSDKQLLTKPQCLRLEKAAKGLKTETNQVIASVTEKVEDHKGPFKGIRLLLVGKTGVGKSKTGNTILGEDKFQTSVGFNSETSKCEIHQALVCGLKVEITDSPGLFDTSERDYAFSEKVVQTVALMFPGAHAFLFIIKIGRFTKEEEGTYMRLKAIFDEHVTKYMVVVFTGGDNLTANGKTIDDIIRTAPDGLKDILNACGGRYVVFDNMAADKQPQVRRLLDIVRRMVKENDNQNYTCPKYMKVGDKMEEEIQKRMMAVEEKEIQNKRYIKELETKTRLLEDMAKKAQDDFDKREEDRTKQFLELQEKVEKRMQALLEKEKQSNLGADEVEKRMKMLQKEKEDIENDFKKKQNEARRMMEEEEKKRKERSDTFMEDMRKAREANQRAYEEEMKTFKESIARNEQKGLFGKVTDGISWLWGAVTSPFRG